MPLSTGRAKLFNAHKSLRTRWERLHDVWNDAVRRDFDENVWKVLDDQAQTTLRATDRLDQVLGQLFRDCGE
jgi:hypothetical protein